MLEFRNRFSKFGMTPRIVGATLGGCLVFAGLSVFAAVSTQLLVLGILVSCLIGLVWEVLHRQTTASTGKLDFLETPFFLAHDQEVFQIYRNTSQSLLRISQASDPIYRDVILERLNILGDEVNQLADGTITFEGTETWRLIYEKLLRSPGLYLYRSIAWIQHRDYWQDEPGRKSMATNLELHDAGKLNVERIAIIDDELWPKCDPLPTDHVRHWIHEQHVHGIWIKLLRQSAIASEPDLLCDMGIYGHRAVGIQELDDHCRTVRFTLSFSIADIEFAEERWRRLSVYAVAYRDLLDQFTLEQ